MDLYSPDGTKYRSEDPVEITRLKSKGYTDTQKRPPTVVQQQFHPADHKQDDVLTYMAEHPAEVDRIIAEEKAGKARPKVLGDHAPANDGPES